MTENATSSVSRRVGVRAMAPITHPFKSVMSRIVVVSLLCLSWPCVATHAAGRQETTRFHSPSLEGNAAGDPPTRSAQVYLPPTYDRTEKRYPVLYLLHGTGVDEHSFDGIRSVADNLIRERLMEEFIIVAANGQSKYAVSFYENSELNGNHRDYIVQDLVNHIDATYRTVPERDSRGVAGHSTGGYGALLFGMKHPDVFGAVYSYSGGGLCFSRPECVAYLGAETAMFSDEVVSLFGNPESLLRNIRNPSQVAGPFPQEMYSMAAAFSPNLENDPMLVDLPWEMPGMKVIPEVRDRWYEHDLFVLLPDHTEALKSLRGLAFDVGDRDDVGLQGENISLHESLLESDVPHEFELFSGGHSDRLFERVGTSFEFFSETLISPETVLPCDIDINGFCDVVDLTRRTLFRVNLAEGSERPGFVRMFDINDDETVDRKDLASWLAGAAEQNGFRSPYLPGDTDLNGAVNFDDFLTLSANFDGSSRDWKQGNFDGDLDVDFADFLALSANFGTELARTKTAPVPEPDASFTAVLGTCLFFLAGKTRRSATT